METIKINPIENGKFTISVPSITGTMIPLELTSGFEGQELVYTNVMKNAVTRTYKLDNETTVTIVDTFNYQGPVIEWATKLYTQGDAWSKHFGQSLKVVGWDAPKFWSTLGGTDDIELGAATVEIGTNASAEKIIRKIRGWSDPLKPQPIKAETYHYGATYFTAERQRIGWQPIIPKTFTMPFYTLFHEEEGLSVIQSLDDLILDASIDIGSDNTITYNRINHRFGRENCDITFHTYIYPHGNDWRYPLEYLCNHYPKLFLANVKEADEVVGCTSYSRYECGDETDMTPYKEMGFRVHWAASFDFPYLGMYLPFEDVDKEWKNFYKEPNTINRMRKNAINMKRNDCHLMNYFNIAEFGQDVQYPYPEVTSTEEDRCLNCNDMLNLELNKAVLFSPCDDNRDEQNGTFNVKKDQPYFSWKDCITLDCGEESFKNYLLTQAKRHFDLIPEGSGLAIDRGDWVRLYNFDADDGVSMVSGRKCRSLYQSWHILMNDLAALAHDYNKVVYINNHVKRLDLLGQTDGIFDEFGSNDVSMNMTSLLATQTPALGWLSKRQYLSETQPDKFLQRYLYLGMHPMVPFPGNDHSEQENPVLEGFYRDYGPMLDMMRGRKWVLEPHCISCDDAKVNLFTIKDGYFIPVMLSSKEEASVTIMNQDINGKKAYAMYPAGKKVDLGTLTCKDGNCTIDLPLERGCAVIIIER